MKKKLPAHSVYNKDNIHELGLELGLTPGRIVFLKFKNELIKKIIDERKKQGLTQAELAKALKIKQPQVARIENGLDRSVSIDYLINILETLSINIVNIKTVFKKAA